MSKIPVFQKNTKKFQTPEGWFKQGNIAVETFCANNCSPCCMGEQTGRKQNLFASQMRTLHLQHMLHRHANKEMFWKNSKSVFPKCFLFWTPTQHMLKTQNLFLESKMFLLKFFRNIFYFLGAILLISVGILNPFPFNTSFAIQTF